jgi:uncharacterized protein (DUF433 family)
MPPRGHYLAHEVGALAGISGITVGSWARYGLISSSQSDGRPRIYAYQDVASAMVVHELERRGVAKADIRWVTSDAELASGTAWPLLHLALFTYSRAASPKRHRPRAELLVRRGGVFLGRSGAHLAARIPNKLDLEEITSLLRDGGWVARDLGVRSIEVDPDRLSGRPTIRGRRLAVEKVAQLAETAVGQKTLRDDYELSKREIEDARRWWQAVEAVKAA